MAIDSLYNVFEVLCKGDAVATLVAAFSGMSHEQVHDFNSSILCLLPKKPTGSDDAMGTYYHPNNTRPLSVSNVDNRLLASAAR